jgi:hypothetical protein
VEIKILGDSTDLRTNTPVIYAQMTIAGYLELVGDKFNVFAIQRRREKHKAYGRMKTDIINGALLPAITLAVKPELVPNLLPLYQSGDRIALATALGATGSVDILDGLQRTYILKDLSTEGVQFKENQNVLLEFWLESNYKHLIYRIIVLNAGQKPMSMRHQLEVLFSIFKTTLEQEVTGLDLIDETSTARRTRARKYALDRIVTSYHSFLAKSPEVKKENVVAQQLVEENILSEGEDRLSAQFDEFKGFLKLYADLDDQICRVYDGSAPEELPVPTGTNWFGLENVMNAFFAAVSDFGSTEDKLSRIKNAIDRLSEALKLAAPGTDPLNLVSLQQITQSFNVRKVNVGFATRKLLTSSFKEFFRDEGERPLGEYWAAEAE